MKSNLVSLLSTLAMLSAPDALAADIPQTITTSYSKYTTREKVFSFRWKDEDTQFFTTSHAVFLTDKKGERTGRFISPTEVEYPEELRYGPRYTNTSLHGEEEVDCVKRQTVEIEKAKKTDIYKNFVAKFGLPVFQVNLGFRSDFNLPKNAQASKIGLSSMRPTEVLATIKDDEITRYFYERTTADRNPPASDLLNLHREALRKYVSVSGVVVRPLFNVIGTRQKLSSWNPARQSPPDKVQFEAAYCHVVASENIVLALDAKEESIEHAFAQYEKYWSEMREGLKVHNEVERQAEILRLGKASQKLMQWSDRVLSAEKNKTQTGGNK